MQENEVNMNTENTSSLENIALSSIENLACFEEKDISSLSLACLDKIEKEMRFFMSHVRHIAAKKRVDEQNQSETQNILNRLKTIQNANMSARADITAFNNLPASERDALIEMANLVKYAGRQNNILMKVKCQLMLAERLAEHNLNVDYMTAHLMK